MNARKELNREPEKNPYSDAAIEIRNLQREYRWWFWDVIQGAIEASAKEHRGSQERLAHVPGETFKQYVDEDGRVFTVELHVEHTGGS